MIHARIKDPQAKAIRGMATNGLSENFLINEAVAAGLEAVTLRYQDRKPKTTPSSHPLNPPLGVMPCTIWRSKRELELARAIHERLQAGYRDKNLREWLMELKLLLEDVT